MQECLSLVLHFLANIPCFFSLGRDQLLGRAGQENISPGISPRISPLHEFWIAGLEALLELVNTAGPKV